jgi:G:T/U-mismatch repair DNA glycosylase
MPKPASAIPTAPLTGLAPVVDAGTRILVLGSFAAAQRYYAHPRNSWRA